MSKLYSLEAVEKMQQRYEEKGGESKVLREGVLLDDVIMYGVGLKTTIASVVVLNGWSSAYSIRSYNKTPKKYEQFILQQCNGEHEDIEELINCGSCEPLLTN